ncbi:MAG: hypothetical protein IPM69_09725 [Ignavibacteria bacterium]|nr:hypothetical protein [Ignavibacteria bacterium]
MKYSLTIGITIAFVFACSFVSGCVDPQKEQPAPQSDVKNAEQDSVSKSVIALEVKSKELLELTLKKIEPIPRKDFSWISSIRPWDYIIILYS